MTMMQQEANRSTAAVDDFNYRSLVTKTLASCSTW